MDDRNKFNVLKYTQYETHVCGILFFPWLDCRNPESVHNGHHQGTNHVVVPFYLSVVGTNVTSARMGLRYTITPILMVNESTSEYDTYFMTNCKKISSLFISCLLKQMSNWLN